MGKDKIVSVGADLGGTRLRVQGVDFQGRPVKRRELPAPPPQRLPRTLKTLWKRWRLHGTRFLTVGSKGIWTAAERESLRRGLQGLAEHVHILSDAELTFESAFTPRGQAPGKTAGILVIAGTGSIALARDNRGRAARAGGLGPKKGDEGSGFWIGREYLRLKSKAKDAAAGPESVARTARLSRRVLKKAGKERACAEILQQAQKHLAGLAVDLAGRLSFAGRIPVCVAGGLFQDSGFQKGFWKALRASSRGRRFIRVSARRDAALAAAQWGGSTLGFPKALWRR